MLLGTDFPFTEFLPGHSVKKVQIDKNPKHIGRRTPVDLGLVGDVKSTVTALLKSVGEKTAGRFLEKHIADTNSFHDLLQHYVKKGPGIKPIRPEFLATTLSDLAADDAMFFIDTGTACMWGEGTCAAVAIVESSVRLRGRPWPMQRPMRSARS